MFQYAFAVFGIATCLGFPLSIWSFIMTLMIRGAREGESHFLCGRFVSSQPVPLRALRLAFLVAVFTWELVAVSTCCVAVSESACVVSTSVVFLVLNAAICIASGVVAVLFHHRYCRNLNSQW